MAGIFGTVSGMELAYSEGFTDFKSVLQADFTFAGGVSALLSVAISPLAKNPHLVIMFGSITAVMILSFWLVFQKRKKD